MREKIAVILIPENPKMAGKYIRATHIPRSQIFVAFDLRLYMAAKTHFLRDDPDIVFVGDTTKNSAHNTAVYDAFIRQCPLPDSDVLPGVFKGSVKEFMQAHKKNSQESWRRTI